MKVFEVFGGSGSVWSVYKTWQCDVFGLTEIKHKTHKLVIFPVLYNTLGRPPVSITPTADTLRHVSSDERHTLFGPWGALVYVVNINKTSFISFCLM